MMMMGKQAKQIQIKQGNVIIGWPNNKFERMRIKITCLLVFSAEELLKFARLHFYTYIQKKNSTEMSSPSAGKRRMDTDVIKLIESNHEVVITGGLNEFLVKFYGPKGTAYEGGVWRVRVDLPEKYPFKSPSIGFMNKIYHPNIDEASGTVCLDVINQSWTALYDLSNIFESFLPQLLTYPNPTDPLNGDAASLYLHKPDEYKAKCIDYVRKYASEEALEALDRRTMNGGMEEADCGDDGDDSDSTISDFYEDETQGMEL